MVCIERLVPGARGGDGVQREASARCKGWVSDIAEYMELLDLGVPEVLGDEGPGEASNPVLELRCRVVDGMKRLLH